MQVKAKLDTASQQISANEVKLQKGEEEIVANEKKLANGEKEIQENETKLKDAEKAALRCRKRTGRWAQRLQKRRKRSSG